MSASPRLSSRTSLVRLLSAGLLVAVASSGAAAQSPRQRAPAVTAVRGTVEGTDVVRSARRYLGVRYVLGGETPAAFDCSGFVRWVFAEYGIQFPRTAKQQAAFGDAPPPGGELRPGDLLFFYGGQGAQHIAIYVGGDTIIHASSSGKRVKLDRLARRGVVRRGWFNQRLIAVRRVLPMEGTFYVGGSGASALPPDQALADTASGSR